jgi:putative inorganic carbon (HCO3(-)) transporter
MHLGATGIAPLVLYLTAVAVFFVSIFRRPEIGLYFIVPLFPLQTQRARMAEYPLGNKLIDIILLGVLLGALFLPGYKLFPKTPLLKLIIAFAIFFYISLWQGALYLGGPLPLSIEDPRFSDWKNYMVMPLTLLLVVSVIREIKQIKILVFLMCCSTLLCDKSVYNAVAHRNLSQFSYDIRDGGVFGYAGANGAGAFEAWFIMLLLALYAYEKKPIRKWCLLGLAAFSTYCLMLTFSRGAYVGFLVGIAIFALVREQKFLLLLIPFLFTWQLIVPHSVTERVTMTESNGELDESSAERVALWEDAKTLAEEHFLIGTGFDTYKFMNRLNIYSGQTLLRDTHNYYLKLIIETGVLGLAFFLFLLGKMCHLGVRLWRKAEDPFLKSIGLGLACAIVPTLVVNIFGDRWQYIQIVGFLWTLAGCVLRGLMLTELPEPVVSSGQEEASRAPAWSDQPERVPR